MESLAVYAIEGEARKRSASLDIRSTVRNEVTLSPGRRCRSLDGTSKNSWHRVREKLNCEFLALLTFSKNASTGKGDRKLCVHCELLHDWTCGKNASMTKSKGHDDGGDNDFWNSSEDSSLSSDNSDEYESDYESLGIEESEAKGRQTRTRTHSTQKGVLNELMFGTLQMPFLPKPRSHSLAGTSFVSSAPVKDDRRASFDMALLGVPKHPRSSSVEVSLPTKGSSKYKVATSCPTARR